MKKNFPTQIILTVDLKAQDPNLTRKVWETLAPFRNEETSIEPVTVLDRADAAMGKYFKDRIGELKPATEKFINEHLSSLKMQGLNPAKVLFADGSSTNRKALALLNYAKKTKCDLIAISSHSRKGLKRFFLGSFAETLSLQSTIPLLVATPHQSAPKTLKTILFPTDFSSVSKAALAKVCNTFEKHRPKIILYHHYDFAEPLYFGPFPSQPLPNSFFKNEIKAAIRKAKEWSEQIKNKGYDCETVMDEKTGTIAESIASVLKNKEIDMLALVSKASKMEAAFLGSTGRELLRISPCPIWILHKRAS